MSKFAQLIPTPTYCLLYLKEAFEFARGHGQPRVRDAVLEKNLVELVPLEQVVVEFETVNIQKVQSNGCCASPFQKRSKLHLQLVLIDDLFPVLVRLPIRVAAVEDVEYFLLGEGNV